MIDTTNNKATIVKTKATKGQKTGGKLENTNKSKAKAKDDDKVLSKEVQDAIKAWSRAIRAQLDASDAEKRTNKITASLKEISIE